MVDSIELYRRFERLVAALFRAENFRVDTSPLKTGFYEGDMLVTSTTTERTAVVECKLYRTRQLSTGTLLNIVGQLERYRLLYNVDRGVLATSARIPRASHIALTKENQRIVVFDYNTLKFIAAKHPRLEVQLEKIFREAFIAPEQRELDEAPPFASTDVLHVPPDDVSEQPPRPIGVARGAELCSAVRATQTGKTGAREFERKVEEALKYIFETDLTAWSTQKVTDSGLSRYDLIARVSSEDDVWLMLKERFQSQYVIFECKNYGNKIKQGEIYTTEKYLFLRALRSVAFLISRTGAHESALAAARGALREHGKLIVNLSVDELCEMLSLRDANGDYNGFLFDKIDQMLMKLER